MVEHHRSGDLRCASDVVHLRERREAGAAHRQYGTLRLRHQRSRSRRRNDAGGGFFKFSGYIFKDGVGTNLNTVLLPGAGLHILYANAINNAGEIVGIVYDSRMVRMRFC